MANFAQKIFFMKKNLFSFTVVILFCGNLFSQPRSIGLRLGGNQELTFQQYLGREEKTFLQIDLGDFYFKGLQASATYNWISAPNNNFAAYGGFGFGFGYSFKDNFWYPNFLNKDSENYAKNLGKIYWFDRYFFAGIMGHVGVEYQFDNLPIAVALDYRPLIGVDLTFKGDMQHYKNDADGKPIPVGNGEYEKENYTKRLKYHVPGLFAFAVSCRYIF
jgi:hypothetical protein